MDSPQTHPVLGGKAYLYKRPDSKNWQAAAYLHGYNYRTTTKEKFLSEALLYAEEWYFNLRGAASAGVLEKPAQKEITFREVADKFIEEYSTLAEGQRSPAWIKGHASRLSTYGNISGDNGDGDKPGEDDPGQPGSDGPPEEPPSSPQEPEPEPPSERPPPQEPEPPPSGDKPPIPPRKPEPPEPPKEEPNCEEQEAAYASAEAALANAEQSLAEAEQQVAELEASIAGDEAKLEQLMAELESKLQELERIDTNKEKEKQDRKNFRRGGKIVGSAIGRRVPGGRKVGGFLGKYIGHGIEEGLDLFTDDTTTVNLNIERLTIINAIEKLQEAIAQINDKIAGPRARISALQDSIDGTLLPAVEQASAAIDAALDALEACQMKGE